MKYLNVFDDKSALDSSVASINHGDGAYVFGVTTRRGIQDVTIYDQRHYGANCVMLGSVNMEPVSLDVSSTKEYPEVGDVLYSTEYGGLTLDAQTNNVDNIPIAICVIPKVYEDYYKDDSTYNIKTARFVSLNYMNLETPLSGNKNARNMTFGSIWTSFGNTRGTEDKNSYIGGKWNTQQCLSKATKHDKHVCGGVSDNTADGYCAAVCCCVAYSTPGTRPGDWYLPMPGELYQIYANKTVIDEKRTVIKGSGFINSDYWSSREHQEEYYHSELAVNLENGDITQRTQNYAFYVLGFLQLRLKEIPM